MTLSLVQPQDDETPPAGMSPDDVQSAVVQMLDQAKQYSQSTLAEFRRKATEYYQGKPFGNEVEGRSQFVVTTVKDTVGALLPDCVEVFSGSENTVEFKARSKEDVAVAEQMTDTVNYVVNVQNPGFLTRYAVFKDAMIRRLGIVKVWWEPGTPYQTTSPLSGVDEQQLILLNNDPSIVTAVVTGTNPQPDGSVLYDIDVTRMVNPSGRVCVEPVPPEEYVFTPNARSQKDALMVAHVTRKTRSQLIEMGIPPEVIDAAGTSSYTQTIEEQARAPQGVVETPLGEPATDAIDYAETYPYLDKNGDGVAELRKVVILGASTVAIDEEADRRPFALYAIDPEPHSIVPMCVADGTMDLQLLESSFVRSILDSAAQTLNPGREVVVGQVEIDDLMNQEVAPIVRVKQPGMIRDLVTPFVGKDMLPMLQMTSDAKEQRFGVSKAAAGLAPDALQSSTHVAVAATVSGSQKHLKLMARMLAEGERHLYELVAKLLAQYQDRAMTIRLRNQYVEVDPRHWQSDMDCVINVALGSGSKEERRAILTEQAARQEAILLKLGPDNPFCTAGQYLETLKQLTVLGGSVDTSKAWKDLPLDWVPPPQQPKPTPEEIYAQIEQEKLALQAQKQQQDNEREMLILMTRETRERDQMEVDAYLRSVEIAAKYNAEVDSTKVKELMAEQRSRVPAKKE